MAGDSRRRTQQKWRKVSLFACFRAEMDCKRFWYGDKRLRVEMDLVTFNIYRSCERWNWPIRELTWVSWSPGQNQRKLNEGKCQLFRPGKVLKTLNQELHLADLITVTVNVSNTLEPPHWSWACGWGMYTLSKLLVFNTACVGLGIQVHMNRPIYLIFRKEAG